MFMLSESLVVIVDSVQVFSGFFCVVFGSFEVIRCPFCGSGYF